MVAILHSLSLAVEAFLLVWFAKHLWHRVFRKDVDAALTAEDNPAVALTLSGYFLGVFIALAGVMASPSQGPWIDLLSFGAFGLVGVAVLFASVWGAPWVSGLSLRRDVLENRNVAAGVVLFANFVATALIFNGAVLGPGGSWRDWLSLFAYQALGQLVLVAMAHLFEAITPHDLRAEIGERQNLAAAVGFAGALVAIGLILHGAVMGDVGSWQANLRSFGLSCLPLLLLWPVRRWVVQAVLLGGRSLDEEIVRDRNVGAGCIEASTYVGFALLVMAAI